MSDVRFVPGRPPKPELPKRFYEVAEAAERDGGFALLLDGRPAKTPARAALALPTAALGDAVAQEWRAQQGVIDPTTMPLTRLANVAIDGVAGMRDEVAEEIVKYAASDLVCYRAEAPDRLVARQTTHWDPVLAIAREAFGARFMLSGGIVHVEQPPSSLEAIRAAVPRGNPFTLAALSTVTTLTGSALIALALLGGRMEFDAAWAAANVDEDWNAELWGEDAEASARTANRKREMRAAATMMSLAGFS